MLALPRSALLLDMQWYRRLCPCVINLCRCAICQVLRLPEVEFISALDVDGEESIDRGMSSPPHCSVTDGSPDPFNFVATDIFGQQGEVTCNVIVVCPPPPQAKDQMMTLPANMTSWFQVRATGSPPLEFDFYSPPAFGNITLPDPVELNMSYVPDVGYCNLEGVPEYIQYSVADVYGQAGEATITVDVVCPASPSAQDVDARMFVGQASVEVRPVVTPAAPYPAYYTYTITSVPKMGNVTFDMDRIVYTYTPFNGSCVRNKVDQFQYRVFDPYTQGPSFANILVDCMPVLRRRRGLLAAAKQHLLGVVSEQPQSKQRGTTTIPPVLSGAKSDLIPLAGRKTWGMVAKGGWVDGVAAHDRSKPGPPKGQQLSAVGRGARQQWWPPGAAANTASIAVPGRSGNPRWALWSDGREPRAVRTVEGGFPGGIRHGSRAAGSGVTGSTEFMDEEAVGSFETAAAVEKEQDVGVSERGEGTADMLRGNLVGAVYAVRLGAASMAAEEAAARATKATARDAAGHHVKEDPRAASSGADAVDALPPGFHQGGNWALKEVWEELPAEEEV